MTVVALSKPSGFSATQYPKCVIAVGVRGRKFSTYSIRTTTAGSYGIIIIIQVPYRITICIFMYSLSLLESVVISVEHEKLLLFSQQYFQMPSHHSKVKWIELNELRCTSARISAWICTWRCVVRVWMDYGYLKAYSHLFNNYSKDNKVRLLSTTPLTRYMWHIFIVQDSSMSIQMKSNASSGHDQCF